MTSPDVTALAAALESEWPLQWRNDHDGTRRSFDEAAEAIIAALAAQNVYLVTAETLASAIERTVWDVPNDAAAEWAADLIALLGETKNG